MFFLDKPIKLTPTQYELAVKAILDGSGLGLQEYKSSHLEAVEGVDGSYVIDVTARFSALGASFLVLVECKHEQRKVERQAVRCFTPRWCRQGRKRERYSRLPGFKSAPPSTRPCTALR
jgi:hypothetical protein